MRQAGKRVQSTRAMALTGLLAMALTACSATPGQQSADPGDTLGNLFAFNSIKAPPLTQEQRSNVSVICPVVDVRDGGAAHRVYSGSGTDNANVRYQYSIGETARECTVENNQIVIKVGVEGKVLLGPAGAASTFNVPVFIGVMRDEGRAMLTSKVYNISASIPSGATQTSFSVVSEPLIVPFTRENAAADYTIYIGFEGQRENRPQKVARSRR